MPAYARKHQLTNSLVYHIFNRSNSRIAIFNSQEDCQHFMKLLIEYSKSFSLKIYHWVIMSNHYHLLLEIEEPEYISKLIAGLNRSYTHYYHKTHFSSGFLWQGRFKLQPVQKEKYLVACGRYIERNPVRANLVSEAQDYPFSSARFYCFGTEDNISKEDPAFIQFGKEVVQRRMAYKEFLCNFNSEEEKGFENIENPRGDSEFIKKLIKEHGRYIPKRRGRPIERITA